MNVSVVIPAYNGAGVLPEALASVANQTRLPEELILVDDASIDGTGDVVGEFSANSPFPVCYHRLPKNTGTPARPLNIGIARAGGKAIALLDQDDLMASDKLQRQVTALADSSVDLVLSDYGRATVDGEVLAQSAAELYGDEYTTMIEVPGSLNLLSASTARRHFLLECGLPSSCSNQFFRKSLWARLGGFDPGKGVVADYDFVLRTLEGPVGWIDRPLFTKRVHGKNLWQDTVANQLATLRIQYEAYLRYRKPPELTRILAANTRRLVRRLRSERRYGHALRETFRLATLPDFRGFLSESAKTPLACLRDHLQATV